MFSSLNSLSGLWAALAWGAADYSGGMGARRTHVLWVVLLSQVVGVLLLGVLALAFGENIPLPRTLLLGAGAGLIGEFGLLALYQGLARGRMGIVAPLSAVISALLPALFGILNEGLPTIIQLGGILVAFPAIWLVSASAEPGSTNKLEITLSLVAGICFGIFFILIDQVSEQAIYWPLIAARLSSLALLLIITLLMKPRPRPGKRALPWILAVGMLDSLGNVFFAFATRTGRLDISAVLGALYPATTVVLAYIFLQERLSGRQWLGVALTLLAVGLIGS